MWTSRGTILIFDIYVSFEKVFPLKPVCVGLVSIPLQIIPKYLTLWPWTLTYFFKVLILLTTCEAIALQLPCLTCTHVHVLVYCYWKDLSVKTIILNQMTLTYTFYLLNEKQLWLGYNLLNVEHTDFLLSMCLSWIKIFLTIQTTLTCDRCLIVTIPLIGEFVFHKRIFIREQERAFVKHKWPHQGRVLN